MNSTFFKIIISNYNNMPYIKKCLDSILEQTFQDFKIIIIDDMSTDLSDKFCEMYARKYPDKITLLYQNTNLLINYNDSYYIQHITSSVILSDKTLLFQIYQKLKSDNYPASFSIDKFLNTSVSECIINTKFIDRYYKNENIIVSMTSWKKRISDVYKTIKLILLNTMKPDKIILNLSTDEFTNKYDDLPENLLNLCKNNDTIEIFWVKENTKPYKKLIPTLERFPNDVIITIDDDVIYPLNFIETLWKYYIDYNRECPITCGTYKWKNNLFSHYGCFSLIKKEFVGKYLNILYNDLVLKNLEVFPFSDPIITYAVLLNNRRYRYTNILNMSAVRNETHSNNNAISKLGNIDYINLMKNEHKQIQTYIKEKFNKSFEDLLESNIIVHCTTYPLRDKYLYESLASILNQSYKPHKILIYLSKDEYDKNNIPYNIQKCIDMSPLIELVWCNKNIYCHKRHLMFTKYASCYNITIDDDFIYKKSTFETLIFAAKENQDSIITLATSKISYNNKKCIRQKISNNKTLINSFMGGCSCFPPYILPISYFNDAKLNVLRDLYVKKCDEAWIRSIQIKYNIPTYACNDWSQFKSYTTVINGSQDNALTTENFKINTKYNLRVKDIQFFNALKIHNCELLAKNYFPNINIDNYKFIET